jgi:hypothetical protein
LLRGACRTVKLADHLGPEESAFYDALPPVVPIWRGCEFGRARGISWTTDWAIAEKFARGVRCINKWPTLASAKIPKQHIFGIFVRRQESEIAVDFRRLRNVVKTPLPSLQPPAEANSCRSNVAGNCRQSL